MFASFSRITKPWARLRTLRMQVEALRKSAKHPPVERAGVGGALDELDHEFHATYERVRDERAHDDPVFVVTQNELVLLHHGARRAWSYSPREYHLLKEVAHVPLAVFTAFQTCDAREPAEHALGRAQALRSWVEHAQREQHDADLQDVLARTLAVLRMPSITRADVEQLAHDTGPALLRMIERATELQLRALHEGVEAALAELTAEQRARLQVVVIGNHQARARSLPMQYFQRRMREPEGQERRVSYGEAVGSEQEALALLGTKALDRSIAQAFFGDATRMQRDLLGDAARDQLQSTELEPIAG